MRKEHNIIVLDTETAGDVSHPLPYDKGYGVINHKGELLEKRSYCIYEVYVQMKELMKSAYYADKLPQYEEELKNGERQLVRLYTARKQMIEDMQKYNVDTIYAYNMPFDLRALNNDERMVTNGKYKYYFPYGTKFACIWNMACQVLLTRPSYIKFALANNLLTNKGNILTNAESCYKYITNNIDFQEEHKGIDDVLIEIQILMACLKQHKKMNREPYTACWRTVQAKRAEMGL